MAGIETHIGTHINFCFIFRVKVRSVMMIYKMIEYIKKNKTWFHSSSINVLHWICQEKKKFRNLKLAQKANRNT